MITKGRKPAIFLLLCLVSVVSVAQVEVLEVNSGKSYYYTEHFETIIDSPVSAVWPHVAAMGEWMPWMASNDPENNGISEGSRIHLYGEYYIEVAKIIPQKMILLVNLPSMDKGEESQGIAMVTVGDANGKTLVSIFMSRIYNWLDVGENPQRATRESATFAAERRATFSDNFLLKLKQIAEAPQ